LPALAYVTLSTMMIKTIKVIIYFILFCVLGESLIALHNQVIVEQ